MATGQFEDGVKNATSALDRFAVRVGLTTGIVSKAMDIIIQAITDAMNFVQTAFSAGVDRIKAFGEAAYATGAPIEALGAIATQSTAGIDVLSKGLQELNQNMLEVASGDTTSKAARTFQALGIAVTDAAGNIRPVMDVLGEIADKLQKYQDGVQKAALGTNLFGASAQSILPVLRDGSEGLRELENNAKAAGVAISQETAQAADNLKSNLNKLNKAGEEFSNKLAIAVLPTLDRFVQSMVDTADKIRLADAAVAVLVVGLKTLVSAGILVSAVFESVVTNAQSMAITLGKVLNGRIFTEGLGEAVEATSKTIETFKKAVADIGNVWAETSAKGVAAGEEHEKKIAPPIIASIKSISDAQKEWNQSVAAGVALADKIRTPYEILGKSLDNLGDAYDAGKISAEMLARAQFAASMVAQNAYAGMASNIAGSLEKVFANSKAVAIASALINTYESVTKALATYPPPFSYIAAAASLAAGLAQVANIRSTSKGSSGGASGGGGAAAVGAPPAAPSQTLRVEGIEPGQLITGDVVAAMARALVKFQQDGGQVVIV